MVSSYPLPEGFSEFDVFSLGSCLLVEGKLCLGIQPNTTRTLPAVFAINLRQDMSPPGH